MENPLDIPKEAEELGALEEIEETDVPKIDVLEVDFPEQTEASERKPRIFISHKRDVAINDEIAIRLAADLKPLCEDVYLDLVMPIGVLYESLIAEKIREADFVIALITAASNQSE